MGGWQMMLEKRDRPVIPARNQYLLDGDAVGCLKLRKAEKSDILEPVGMEGKKSVFSILREKGIPAPLRTEWPVVADEKHVYWVGLLRGSRRGRTNEQTKSFLLQVPRNQIMRPYSKILITQEARLLVAQWNIPPYLNP